MKENKNRMKNAIIMFICFMMCLALAACSCNGRAEGDANVITEDNIEDAAKSNAESLINNAGDDPTIETAAETTAKNDANKDAHNDNGRSATQPTTTGNNNPTQGTTGHQHKWTTYYKTISTPAWDEQVVTKQAWDEKKLIKAAWDETVVVEEAWDEEIPGPIIGYISRVRCTYPGCGEIFEGYSTDKKQAGDIAAELWSDHKWSVHKGN